MAGWPSRNKGRTGKKQGGFDFGPRISEFSPKKLKNSRSLGINWEFCRRSVSFLATVHYFPQPEEKPENAQKWRHQDLVRGRWNPPPQLLSRPSIQDTLCGTLPLSGLPAALCFFSSLRVEKQQRYFRL
jgi:hypothetical protein